MRRVVITGAGSINALGNGTRAFAEALRNSRCGIAPLTLFDASGYRTSCAAEVRDLTPPAWLKPAVARHSSRSDLLALIAAHEALAQAGADSAASGLGIVLGTTVGGMPGWEEYFRQGLVGQRRRRHAVALTLPVSTSVDVLAAVFGCSGPRLTLSTACSSGSNALGVAVDWIRAERAPAVLCGGVDALCRMTFSGFNALQALDAVPCRPFDRDRAGLTLGEGAAMFVLEEREHARARGARILAEFLGYGVSADAHHITQPRPDGAGAAQALQRALDDSRVRADEIDYVNAHGTATPLNDVLETRALKAALGARAHRIPISSTKSMVGHCLGAAGAIEALACIVALREGFVPPTLHLEHPDPECDLDYVPNRSRPHAVHTVMSNSYGFGGNNTSIVLRGVG